MSLLFSLSLDLIIAVWGGGREREGRRDRGGEKSMRGRSGLFVLEGERIK